jgi:hypothetical protein
MSKMLKTAALLAGGMAALGAARRFSRKVPQSNTVAIFETIGKVPGKKGSMIGYPVHATSEPIEDSSGKAALKEVRKGVREADAWLAKSSKGEDGGRQAHRTLGGNRDAICEFVVVKRTRKGKGRSIGIVKRCFTRPGVSTEEETAVEPFVQPPAFPGVPPGVDFDPMLNGWRY